MYQTDCSNARYGHETDNSNADRKHIQCFQAQIVICHQERKAELEKNSAGKGLYHLSIQQFQKDMGQEENLNEKYRFLYREKFNSGHLIPFCGKGLYPVQRKTGAQ